jgi:hypothetical protein
VLDMALKGLGTQCLAGEQLQPGALRAPGQVAAGLPDLGMAVEEAAQVGGMSASSGACLARANRPMTSAARYRWRAR